MLECRCGRVLHPPPPEGRWVEDPHSFSQRHVIPVPLAYNILLSRPGPEEVVCEQCRLHYKLNWQIVWNPSGDGQGKKVRYVLGKPEAYVPCESSDCKVPWLPEGETFCPAFLSAGDPCHYCRKQILRVHGDGALG